MTGEGDAASAPRQAAETAEDLARRAREGSRDAFAALVDRFQGPLFRLLLARVRSRDEAEDLCQDAFLRAWQNLDRYDARYRFSTWLFTIAQRLATSRARKRRPELGAEVDGFAPAGDDPARTSELADERESLWALAERHLTDDQRTALWLRYAEDLPYDELARVLDRPVSTVRVQLFRARRVLERKLAEREAVRDARRTARAPLFPLRAFTGAPAPLDPPAGGGLR